MRLGEKLRRVRPSTPISVLALVLALAGTATAAGLIDGGDVKNNSLTGKDVKNKSLTKADFKGSVRGPQGPAGQDGQTGETGPTGAAGSAVAYAHIVGGLDATNSKNITAAKVDEVLDNYYCIDVSVPVHNAVATLDGISGGEIVVTAGDPFMSCTGTNNVAADFTVQTFDSAGNDQPSGFYIVFN